jgi:uncharacterized protein YutE (UPF0331/DUF86 family)/predicted nucleotidyltransferase
MPEGSTGLLAQLAEVGAALHARFPEIIALYLFGSRAEGGVRPDSDIDLAVLTAPDVPCAPHRFFAYYAPLSALLRTDKIDLVWLNQAQLALQWRIVRTGTRLFCSDATAAAEFVERIACTAHDNTHYARLSQAWYCAFLARTYLHKGKRPMLDRPRIMQKIDYIRNTCQPALRQLTTLPTDRFTTDPIALGAAKYYLQTGIEVMLDMANHIVSRQGLGTFETHARTFEVLVEHGIVQREYLETYQQMIGLRNRLVHVYETIDPAILHGVVTETLEDFDAFIADVTRLLMEGQRPEEAG